MRQKLNADSLAASWGDFDSTERPARAPDSGDSLGKTGRPASAPRESSAEPPGSSEKTPQGGDTEPHAPIPKVAGGTQLTSEVALRELRSFPVDLIPKLPAMTLYLRAGGITFAVTTSRKAYEALRRESIPTFVGGELKAIAHAAENDRLFARDLTRCVIMKRKRPHWRLTSQQALGQVYNIPPLSWSLGSVLERTRAQLLAIETYNNETNDS